MAKIKIEDISNEAKNHGWELVSKVYKNLNTEMEWKCPEGHLVYSNYKKIRNNFICPNCEQDIIEESSIEIFPKEKNVTRVLALDQSTQVTGWAIFDNKNLIMYGKIHFTQADSIERISKVKQWLVNMIINWKPDRIALEDIQLQSFQVNGKQKESVTTYKALAQLQGVLAVVSFEKHIPYSIIHTATWRAHCKITAKQRADQKRAAQLLVKEKYDKNVTQDEADAICIGLYMVEKYMKNNEMIDFSTL